MARTRPAKPKTTTPTPDPMPTIQAAKKRKRNRKPVAKAAAAAAPVQSPGSLDIGAPLSPPEEYLDSLKPMRVQRIGLADILEMLADSYPNRSVRVEDPGRLTLELGPEV